METVSISLEKWHALAQAGAAFSIQTLINGVSMMPLVRRNRDKVTIMPRRQGVVRGDVVVFHDPVRERYVLHRVWHVTENAVLTWGDNCTAPDGWMPLERVLGVAVSVQRGKKEIRLDGEQDRKRGILLAKARHTYCRVRGKIHRAAVHLPKPVKTALKKCFRR